MASDLDPIELEIFIAQNKYEQEQVDIGRAKNAAASTVLRTPVSTTTENPDGTVSVRTTADTTRTIPSENLADYQRSKASNLLLYEEERNKADAVRRWGLDNQQAVNNDQTSLLAPNENLLKAGYVKDFDSYAGQVQKNTGNLPYDTPFTDRQTSDAEFRRTLDGQRIARDIASRTADGTPGAATTVPGSAAPLEEEEFKRLGEYYNADPRRKDEAVEAAKDFNADLNTSVKTALLKNMVSGSQNAAEVDEKTATANSQIGNSYGNPSAKAKVTDKTLPEVPVTGVTTYNVLDNYDSYTYGLALHILDKSEYNAMVENAGKDFKPKTTLIASAGRDAGPTGTKRAPGWEDNFFFDKLSFSSILGLNKDSRGTNVINIDFTIIEPMGLSLIDRLIRTTKSLYAAGRTASGNNNTTEITYFHNCYLLQIDFFDSQEGCLTELRKFLPIKLTDLKIKVTSRGSEYSFSAQPFGHQAFFQSIASTPANFECVAGTLREFFQTDDASSAQAATAVSNREITQAGVTNTNNAVLDRIAPGARAESKPVAVQNVKSYVAAYNAWYKELKKFNVTDKTKESTRINVVFDDEFLKNNADKLYREGIGQAVGDTPMVDDKTSRPANGGNIPSDKVKDRFVIAAGTQVTEVINMAMANTDYIRKQIIIPEKQAGAASTSQTVREGPLNWWKIIPSIKLLDFDPVSNKWAFNITYFVIPFQVMNTVHPHVPRAKPTKEMCVREYNYLYSGDNVSVIDFQVDFDYLYFVKVLALRDKATDSSTRAETVKTEEKTGSDSNDRKSSNNIASPSLQFVTDENNAAGKRLRSDETGMAVANVMESVYSSARGEMLNVTMKIIGDPAFIKQDDMFTGLARALSNATPTNASNGVPVADATIDARKTLKDNNNSIPMDASDVMVWVSLRLPVDMDTTTGGVRKEKQGDISSFTGVYKVMSVDTELSRGQFTQTLQMIRYMDQPADEQYRQFNSERLSGQTTPGRNNAGVDNFDNVTGGNDSSMVNINNQAKTVGGDETYNSTQQTLEAFKRGVFAPQTEDFQTDINQQDLINTFREA